MRTRSQKRAIEDDQFYCLDAKRKPVPVVPNNQFDEKEPIQLSKVSFLI